MKVLIVDEGRERSSVAAARALVSRGWTVGAGSLRPNLASRSKAVSAWHEVPHTELGDDQFVQGLDEVVRSQGYDAVFVVWDRAVAALSAARDLLEFPVGYGSHAGLMVAMDKLALQAVASRAGLRVPRTVAATADALAGLTGPIVIKPASPVEAGVSARSCASPADALAHAKLIEAAGGRAMAQESIKGQLVAVSLVVGPTGVLTYAQQVAQLTWPRPAGITARGVTTSIDEALRKRIEAMLDELQYRGLAHLQFLVPSDGEPRLIDLNTRYYGSMALAIRAGANHPDAWARMAVGRPVTPATGAPGAHYQWFSRDLRASLAADDRVRELARFALVTPTAAHNLWSWSEPGLAPSFLAAQLTSRVQEVVAGRTDATRTDVEASARLHGVEATTPAVRRALRSRRVPPRPQRILQRLETKAGRLSYEDDWLAPLQAARRAVLGRRADGPPRLLVRVDEFPYYSGFDNPRFGYEASERFHSVLAEEGVPHLLAVVPQWTHEPMLPEGSGGRDLDDRDRELLERMRRDGVSFGQHGTTHRTRETHPRRQSELCGLDDAELDELLGAGASKLAAVGIEPRVLVPPFNRFDAGQWPVLARRYDVITGGPESIPLLGFHGSPLWRGDAVYLPCYPPLYDTAAAILSAVQPLIAAQIGTWIPIGLHMGWEIDDDYAALRRLARAIAPYATHWDEFLGAVDESRAS
jgi:predicted ATP-grasp superfamily ATP-dependent carboligase